MTMLVEGVTGWTEGDVCVKVDEGRSYVGPRQELKAGWWAHVDCRQGVW